MDALSKEAEEARKEYYRQWRKANPDKVKRHKQNYWEKKARELQEVKRCEKNADDCGSV